MPQSLPYANCLQAEALRRELIPILAPAGNVAPCDYPAWSSTTTPEVDAERSFPADHDRRREPLFTHADQIRPVIVTQN